MLREYLAMRIGTGVRKGSIRKTVVGAQRNCGRVGKAEVLCLLGW